MNLVGAATHRGLEARPNVKDEQIKTLVEAAGLSVALCTDQILSLRKALGERQVALHLDAPDRRACLPWLLGPRPAAAGNPQ